MTYYIELSIECQTEQNANVISNYFNNWVTTSSRLIKEKVVVYPDIENNYWVDIYFEWNLAIPNLSYLYKALKLAPPVYRYALTGREVSEFKYYSELIEDLPTIIQPGLVISTKLSRRLTGYEEFSPGYVWQPYIIPYNLR